MIRTEIKPYKTFGNCVYATNGTLELCVTVERGPRIIHLSLCGKENMYYNDTEFANFHDEPPMEEMFGKDARWNICGGHRFWVSPEKFPETYYPDNEPVKYSVEGNVLTFYAKKQVFTGWQETLTLTMDEEMPLVSVKHTLTNMSDSVKEGAIWSLNVTDKGGEAYVKQADADTGLLPNRTLMLWDYADVTDKRFVYTDTLVGLKQDVNAKKPFKLGTNHIHGRAVCLNHGTAMTIDTPYFAELPYPDNGCSAEMYSCADFLEVETLSPLYVLDPGCSCEHVEVIRLYPEEGRGAETAEKYLTD